jgi:hypothetical protein
MIKKGNIIGEDNIFLEEKTYFLNYRPSDLLGKYIFEFSLISQLTNSSILIFFLELSDTYIFESYFRKYNILPFCKLSELSFKKVILISIVWNKI